MNKGNLGNVSLSNNIITLIIINFVITVLFCFLSYYCIIREHYYVYNHGIIEKVELLMLYFKITDELIVFVT